MSFTAAELMAIVLSRRLQDGDVVITGANAAIPTAAYRVAQELTAPGIVAINGPLGTIDPTIRTVPPSSADERLGVGRFNVRLLDTVAAETRSQIDVICLGALQVDRRGRCNLANVGDYDRPTLRGPGTLGLSLMATVPRVLMYINRHDVRTFVERVDFVSAHSIRSGGLGLELIVTPLAVLGPDPDNGHVRLISIHPGVSQQEVRERTGFDLGPAQEVPVTSLPSAQEEAALHALDGEGILAGLDREGTGRRYGP
jgi:glutaconate CoA-transferase subunit B